jgi:polyisoprenoid-binding protein YceI
MNFRRVLIAMLLIIGALCQIGSSVAYAQSHYTIKTKDSAVKYFMEHPMHKWDATSKSATGIVDLDSDLTASKISVTIPITSFDSDNSNRDSHMAEVVESYIYQDVSFLSTKIITESYTGENHHKTGSWNVEGNITFHGVTKKVILPVAVMLEGNTLNATGELELKLTDFGIELPSLLMLPVKDWIRITFRIAGETEQPPSL